MALAILILVGVLSLRSTVQDGENRALVTHTHLVLEDLDAVLISLLDADSGQRGYIITGERAYLETYNVARAQARLNATQLRALTADNPTQVLALDRLEPMIATILSLFEDRIYIRDAEGIAAATKAIREGAAMLQMDEIRAVITGMRVEENQLLVGRSQRSAASSRKTGIINVVGGSLAVVFLCLAGTIVGQGITQRKRSEEIRQLNMDLEQRVMQRTAELVERAKELARSNAELQQFAYVASHDLQEPLRMVASFTQLLAKRYGDKLDNDAREFINYAVDGANRMQTLISDLLNYSRTGTQGKPLVPTESGAILNSVMESLKIAIGESGAFVSHDPMPMVTADPQQLGQLFQNLLVNAIKFRGELPPRIQILTERSGTDWKISVRDNGIGVSEEHVDRIFVIFQRLHTKTEYPGTGIGLAICKKIVEGHGGRIWIEPSPGGGTTFCFTIPAAESRPIEDGVRNELRVSDHAN